MRSAFIQSTTYLKVHQLAQKAVLAAMHINVGLTFKSLAQIYFMDGPRANSKKCRKFFAAFQEQVPRISKNDRSCSVTTFVVKVVTS